MSPHRDMDGDRDDRIEELLRSSLHEEAGMVTPAGDGLSRIQRRVTANRARQRWLRPALALGSAALIAAVGIGAYALTNDSNSGNDKVAVPGDTSTPTPTDSSTPPPSESPAPVANTRFPQQAIFPFTTAAQERAWEVEFAAGHSPWEADATAVATSWVQNYLDQPAIDQVVSKTFSADGKSAQITLGRTMTTEQKRTVPVTTVRLVKYGKAWVVIGADDPAAAPNQLVFSSPDPGAVATSPLTVTGPGFGVDEAAQIEVRDAATPTLLGHDTVSFGAGTPQWSTDISFSAPASGTVGVLVGRENSAADGGPQRLVAQQVRFGASAGGNPPQYFYAVKNNRIAKFASRNGAAVSYLTQEQPGGGPSDPQLNASGELVYFLQGAGTCANTLVSVATGGAHDVQSVATPDNGYVITGYSVLNPAAAAQGSASDAVAFYETACDSSQSPQAKLVMRTWSGDRHVVKFPSQPPALVGDPAWESDGTHVDAYVRTGNQGYLARYDATSGGDSTPSANACPSYDVNSGEPQALEVDATGTLWFAVRTGTSMQVIRCAADNSKVAFTVSGNDQPADVDVSSDGSAVLLTDTAGKVWRWDGSGQPTELSPAVPLDHVTW